MTARETYNTGNRGDSESENEISDCSNGEQSEPLADESDLSDLDLFIRRRRAAKRDMATSLSSIKEGSKRSRVHGGSESPPYLHLLNGKTVGDKRVGASAASKKISSRTAMKKVTPKMTSRCSIGSTPGSSSRHSTPRHSASDDFSSFHYSSQSTQSESVTRSSTSPGTPNIPGDDASCRQRITPLTHLPKDSENHETVKILNEVHNMLHTLVKRVEGAEKELKEIKRHMSTPSSSDSSAKKKEVPNIVRSETRKMYKTLLDESEDFSGFYIGEPYTWRSDENQVVVRKLISEVMAINPKFQGCDVREAAQTYYKTLCQEQSLERRGNSDERKKSRRRRERTSRKLEERLSVFKKRVYSQEDQTKWMKVLIPALMSSEESEDEENVNYVKDLPWRARIVKEFFSDLDKQFEESKSAQAKRQRVEC